jgi:hypothetical protein
MDFSKRTKEIIAALSGYKCSFPDCNRSTGPSVALGETASIGVAAHIYAVSLDESPKAAGLTENEFNSPENGIWLCADHACLVDTSREDKYPSALLHSYKALHESRIARENQGIESPFGWFHEIRIEKSPIFSSNQIARLAKLTLIIGNNATGKSALCEWLAGFSDFRHAQRWRKGDGLAQPINVFLKYYNPGEKILEMAINEAGHVNYLDNGVGIPFNASPMKILYPRPKSSLEAGNLSDLQLISLLLGFDENVIVNLCEEVRRYEHSMIKNIEFKKNKDGGLYLCLDMREDHPGLSFDSLSAGQQECVLIEFAAAAARIYAKHLPTLLIFDGTINNLHESWLKFYIDHFNKPSTLFQTVLVTPIQKLDVDKLKWLGWETIRTKGSLPEIIIEQSMRSSDLKQQ